MQVKRHDSNGIMKQILARLFNICKTDSANLSLKKEKKDMPAHAVYEMLVSLANQHPRQQPVARSH